MLFGILFGTDDVYSKVEVFETEQEYIEFKKDLASIEIKSMDIEILASEPPIIVDYTIKVSRGETFRDEKTTTEFIDGKEWILAIIGGVCLTLGLWIDFGKQIKEEKLK